MHRLVAVGTWEAVEADVSPSLSRQLRDFQEHIRRDGIRRVTRQGLLRHDCPPAPSAGAGRDCFVFGLSGRQVIPVAGIRTINARFRLWVAREEGAWLVINYEYDVLPGG